LKLKYPTPVKATGRNPTSLLLDAIIEELITKKGSKFYVYDKEYCLYKRIVHSSELRQKISQFVRDEKKRMNASGIATLLSTSIRAGSRSGGSSRPSSSHGSGREREEQQQVSHRASVATKKDNKDDDDDDNNINMNIDSGASSMGVNPKRFKKDGGDCRSSVCGRGGGCF